MVRISLRVNKTLIKLLGDNFADKMQPNELTSDFENVFKLVSFFLHQREDDTFV